MVDFWKNNRLLALMLLFLAAAVGIFLGVPSHPDEARYVGKVQARLRAMVSEVNGVLDNDSLLVRIVNKRAKEAELRYLEEKIYTFCIYENERLVFWSNNKVMPFYTEVVPTRQRFESYQAYTNGKYQLISDYFSTGDGREFTVIGLIPIQYTFGINNDYLRDNSALCYDLPSYASIQPPDAGEGLAVFDSDGQVLFSILYQADAINDGYLAALLVMLLGALFCFLLFLNGRALAISEYRPFWGLVFLVVSIVAMRWLFVYFDVFQYFRQLSVFNPSFYADTDWLGSLGELLLNIFLAGWVILYFFQHFEPTNWHTISKLYRYSLAVVIFLGIMGGIFLLSKTYNSVALNSTSEISLDLDNIFGLSLYSVLMLVGMTVLTSVFFIGSYKLMRLLWKLHLSSTEKAMFLAVAMVIVTLLNLSNLFDASQMVLFVCAILYTLILHYYVYKHSSQSLPWILLWLIVLSGLSSVLLYHFNTIREYGIRKRYAYKLAQESDSETEKEFIASDGISRLSTDAFVKRYFTTPFMPRQEIVKRIERLYLHGYLSNRYQYTISLFSPQMVGIKGEQANYFFLNNQYNQALPTNAPMLRYINNLEGSSYVSKFAIKRTNEESINSPNPVQDTSIYGYVFITFEPKQLQPSNVYQQLLFDRRMNELPAFSQYHYAIYVNGYRMREKGLYYPHKLNFTPPPLNEIATINTPEMSQILYRPTPEKVIIVGKSISRYNNPISIFSYMFCLQLLWLISFVLFIRLFRLTVKGFTFNLDISSSLRSRINFWLVAMILLSFIIVAIVTVFYLRNDYREGYADTVKRNFQNIITNAQYQMDVFSQYDTTGLGMSIGAESMLDIKQLSQIHQTDINFYNIWGQLYNLDGVLATSQPSIIDNRIMAPRINPIAYYNLEQLGIKYFVQSEEMFGLKYTSVYAPLYNRQDILIGYLNVPYSSEELIKTDTARFLGTLLNVYVFLLIIAGLVALLVGNSVTLPLLTISEKLKQVKFGNKNEPLQWHKDDEIGALIDQYNKMIVELEKSANLLAQTNREIAWREMAKQVAHEIKNPLTPMKLSIQHLQRAFQTDPEKAQNLMQKVTATLIEQIDSLSQIATSFSDFAKIQSAQNETFILNNLLTSIYDLFAQHDNVILYLEMPPEPCHIYADKKQILRVFNNILKNSIQAAQDNTSCHIQITLTTHHHKALVQVTDNGCGIPTDKQPHIFTPNFTTKSSGTGLGLAISKNIIEQANGSIYFTTQVNEGTTFYVELPLATTPTTT